MSDVTAPKTGNYQLIGPSDEADAGSLLAGLDARESRQRLQALIAEWLGMENLVVLTGAGCSCSSGGKRMADLEAAVLDTVKAWDNLPASLAPVIDTRLAATAEDKKTCGFEEGSRSSPTPDISRRRHRHHFRA